MSVLLWILIGLAAGYIASKFMGGSGGLLYNLAIGLVGAVVGGFIFRVLGIATADSTAGALAAAIVGSLVFLAVWRAIRGA